MDHTVGHFLADLNKVAKITRVDDHLICRFAAVSNVLTSIYYIDVDEFTDYVNEMEGYFLSLDDGYVLSCHQYYDMRHKS